MIPLPSWATCAAESGPPGARTSRTSFTSSRFVRAGSSDFRSSSIRMRQAKRFARERAFVDDGRSPHAHRAGARQVVLRQWRPRFADESNGLQLVEDLLLRQETLRLAIPRREHERLAWIGLRVGSKCVTREREEKQSRAGTRDACGFG